MKFLWKSLAAFIAILLILKYFVFLLNPGHTVKYNIGNFEIKEILNTKNNNNYYFEIEGEKTSVNFQINKNYNKEKRIIKKLIYQKIDEYECFLPIFKNNQIITDVLCLKENTIYNIRDLKIDKEIFKKQGYDENKYKDNSTEITVSNTETLYKKNVPKNSYIASESYRGLTLFGSKDSIIKLFENDVYKKEISIYTGKYYLVADYNSEYTFKNFHLVNIINGEKKTIRSYDDISFDSYIMGSVDGEVYLFDKENQKQYKINIKEESVDQIGSKDNIKYYDGSWKIISLKEALNGKQFENNKANIKGYDKAQKIDNYYYLYKKEDDRYKVYRADIQNKNLKTYLFETSDLKNIIYTKDKIYYRNGNTFYYYGENGNKKILKNTELEFNSDISLGVYEK